MEPMDSVCCTIFSHCCIYFVCTHVPEYPEDLFSIKNFEGHIFHSMGGGGGGFLECRIDSGGVVYNVKCINVKKFT